MENMRKDNDEVFYAKDMIVKIDRDDIECLNLKRRIVYNKKKIRLCVHRSPEDRIHEMLIILERDTYVRPHKHIGKIESFHIIKGAADVIIYDDKGLILDVLRMGEYESGRFFYYRLANPLFHTLRITSDHLVFHETTNGPFKKFDTVFAPWAPDENDRAAVIKFMEELKNG